MATVKSIPRAVIYTRVSTEQQSDGTSLAGQYASCAKRAQDEGATIVKHYEETQSGGLYQSRGELQKALADIESGRADTLIIYRLDRTGRDVDALRDVRRRVEAAGARLVFADGMTFEKGAIGNLMFTQMSAFAEFERELITERMVAGQERVAQAGKQPARSNPPYGYYIWQRVDMIRGLCTNEQLGTYILREEEAKWIKPLFERLASGESLRSVASWLHREGAPTRTGRSWNPGTLVRLVEKEVYIGRPAWRKNRRMVDESRAERGVGIAYEVPRPKEEHFIFDAPALVDEDLWRRANETVKAGRFERSGRNDARYMLTGYITCPTCGRRMIATPSTMKTLVPKRVHLFRCLGAVQKNSQVERACAVPSIIGTRLDEFVTEALTKFFESPAILEQAVTEFKANQNTKSQESKEGARLRQIEREISSCRQREEMAATKEIDAAIKGQDSTVFADLREQNALKRHELENERVGLVARRAISQVQAPTIETDVATRLVAALRSEGVSPIEKNLLLRPIVKIVYPYLLPPELRVSAKKWREQGCPEPVTGNGGHPSARYLGGCDIVLRFGTDVVFILSHHVTGWESTDSKGHRKSLNPIWQTTLRVEEENPFPLDWKKLSGVATKAENRRLDSRQN